MMRLGLERQYGIVRRNVGILGGAFVMVTVIVIVVLLGFSHILVRSSFGPLISVIASDPDLTLKFWHSWFLSVAESLPGIVIAALALALALMLLCARLTSVLATRLLRIKRSIDSQSHGYIR